MFVTTSNLVVLHQRVYT